MAPDDATHRDALRTAAKALYQALEPKDHVGEREAARSKFKDKESTDDPSNLTPEDEVLLLHVLE